MMFNIIEMIIVGFSAYYEYKMYKNSRDTTSYHICVGAFIFSLISIFSLLISIPTLYSLIFYIAWLVMVVKIKNRTYCGQESVALFLKGIKNRILERI